MIINESSNKRTAVYSFGHGEGSKVYDKVSKKTGESDRDFERRTYQKYLDDMQSKESNYHGGAKVYMKYLDESSNNDVIDFSNPKIQKKIYDKYNQYCKKYKQGPGATEYSYKAYTSSTYKLWYDVMMKEKFIDNKFISTISINESSEPKISNRKHYYDDDQITVTSVKVTDNDGEFYIVGLNDTDDDYEQYELYQTESSSDADKFARSIASKVKTARKSGNLDRDLLSWKSDLNRFARSNSK